ncbi:hypothetical protein C8N38_105242 [Rhodovulum kholense]|uniref:Uncharacterized protein n=2 Tax=Rhodovulum TaxID=34008 RepID=A0A8E2VMC6_9RHOB|nr:hypothetical protein C8N38_105242 [Rhodovulum kholense]
MQFIAPISVGGAHDVAPTIVAPAAPTAPVAAAGSGGGSSQTRSETGQRGQTPMRQEFPAPDPDRPAGPPPAFDTTPLQLEAERRQNEASVFWRVEMAGDTSEPAPRQLDIEV